MKREFDVEVDPDYANKLLDANPRNRKVYMHNRERYAADMKAGNWRNIGDPIRIGKTGNLLDGQTRLHAVVDSGTTQIFDIYSQIPDEYQALMDTGRSRSPGDVFSMNGIIDPNTSASIARQVIKYREGTILSAQKQISNNQLLEFARENSTRLDEASRRGRDGKRALQMNPTVAGTLYFLSRDVADVFESNYFFERLFDGMFLTPGNPIATFRNFIIRRHRDKDLRIDRNEYLFYAITAWNNWAQGESVTKMQLPKGGLVRSNQFKEIMPVLPGVIPAAARDEFYTPTDENQVIKEGGGNGPFTDK